MAKAHAAAIQNRQNSPSGRQISCLGTFVHAKSGTRLSGVRGAGSGCKP